jgi:hypothetical protein
MVMHVGGCFPDFLGHDRRIGAGGQDLLHCCREYAYFESEYVIFCSKN